LIASEANANGVIDVTASVPVDNPYGSDSVGLVNGLQRALGFASPIYGLGPDGIFLCDRTRAGCYDGIITISALQPLYFRTGSIANGQYDFFTVVEHETDEILGTASCVAQPGCASSNMVFPADFYRYQSDGTRTFYPGTNNSCSSSDSTNACFSLDGVHMLQQYNNLNDGEDFGDWVPNCATPRVQNSEICSGTAGVDISPTAEILALAAFGYTLRTPFVQVLSSANPAIVWIASSSLASAYGTQLATSPLGSTPLPLPTSFGGTSISIQDSSGATSLAPLLYVSPSQVNFEVPPGLAIGAAQVTVTSGDGTQSVANVQIAPVAPGLFELNSAGLAAADVVLYHSDGTQTVEQVYTVDSAGTIAANPVSLGSRTDQAYLLLFGTGLQAAATGGVEVFVDGIYLPVQYAGPQGGYAGLDQVNVRLPAFLRGMDNVTIQLTANGYAANLVNITLQ
jgi:uncharacterized protein (TIGR03437 family)